MRTDVSHNKIGRCGKKYIRRASAWPAAQAVSIRCLSSICAVAGAAAEIGELIALLAGRMPKIASSVNEDVREGGQG